MIADTVFEVTHLQKLGGPMTKHAWLGADGRVISDGSACLMWRGIARRARVSLSEFAGLIAGLDTCEAITLGALRDDLPDSVRVETQDQIQKMNGAVAPDIIARTSDFIRYRPDQPGFLLCDYDQKAMPDAVRKQIDDAGGWLAVLQSVLPQLDGIGSVLRASTSAGLYREDTGERFLGSGGAHKYIGIADASDAERALRIVDSRCWLNGFGWMMIGKGGALLKRSIVDRMVGGAERISFEGTPILDAPLRQDPRPAQVFPGGLLDTRTHCPELTLTERTKLKEIERAEIARLKPEAEKVRASFIEDQAERIAAGTGCTTEAARYVVERQCHGVLLPPVMLPFDAEEFARCSVADVLADPPRFDRATLADPVEGVEYGFCKAMIMRRADGTPWINSFAHGRAVYELKYDAGAVDAAIMAGTERAAPDIAVRMLSNAEVNKTDEDLLISLAAKRGKVGKRAIGQRLKDLRSTAKAARANEAQAAAAPTSLPEIVVVQGLRHEAADAGIAAMHAANVQFYQRAGGLVRVCSTPARTSDGKEIVVPGVIPVPSPMLGRALNSSAVWRKPGSEGEAPARIDCPRDVVEEVAVMAWYWPFPPLVGVIGTQTMRPDGSLLCTPGYDPSTGLYLHEPPTMPEIPQRPTWQDAEEALSLLNGLLTEFPFADNVDRSVGMSMLVTPVLRAALGPAVPMHVVSAPSAGSGKSYLCDLGSVISIGERCPVTAVAPREEETEKRLIGSALAGHPIIALDNCNGVLSGDFLAQLTERPVLDLRALGSSDKARINNVFIVYATGNNIIIHGDLTRRAARAKLDANTADPLTRVFTSNPVQTVLADRGRYVAAILTIARAYIVAGMPNKPHRVPSYELWSDMVCGALVWLGWQNPADTMTVVRQEDPFGSELATILAAWPNLPAKGEAEGHTADDLIAAATAYGNNAPVWPEWLEALQDVGKNKLGQLDAHTLGRWLARNRDRMIETRKLVRCGTPTRPRWKVEIHTSDYHDSAVGL